MARILRSQVPVRPVRMAARPRVVNAQQYQAGKNAGELARAVVNTIKNVSMMQARGGTRGR